MVMTTMTFDKLAYFDRMKAAGFSEPQARAMTDGLDQALREEVATKSDISSLRSEIALLRSDLSGEITSVRSELSREIASVQSDLMGEIGSVRGEVAVLKGDLLAAMKTDKIDLLKWVVMLIVGQTAVFTALKLLGH
jgi:hypothetical protein